MLSLLIIYKKYRLLRVVHSHPLSRTLLCITLLPPNYPPNIILLSLLVLNIVGARIYHVRHTGAPCRQHIFLTSWITQPSCFNHDEYIIFLSRDIP